MRTTKDDRRFYDEQLKMARQLLARKGLDGLENPHAMTGRKCGCGDCFCCAALAVFNAAHGSPKIYWRDLDASIDVIARGAEYRTTGGSLVFWMGHEATEAMNYLDGRTAERSAAR